MTEGDLLAEVVRLCQDLNLHHYHSADARLDTGNYGFPDLVILGTVLLFAELKSDIGRMSDDQWDWRFRLQKAGCRHVIWTPRDLADGTIEHILRSLL